MYEYYIPPEEAYEMAQASLKKNKIEKKDDNVKNKITDKSSNKKKFGSPQIKR